GPPDHRSSAFRSAATAASDVRALDWIAIKQKQSSSNSRSSPSRPVRRNSSRRASIAGCLASYSIRSVSMLRKAGFKDSAIRLRTIRLAGRPSAVRPGTPLPAAPSNHRSPYARTTSLLYPLSRLISRIAPDHHELVWKALKSGAKARQEINLQAAEDLLKATNDIASIFWKTKGFETITAKAPYPTERLNVYPKFK